MAMAADLAGAALYSSEKDYCVLGAYSSRFEGSPIKFGDKLVPCGLANGASKFTNLGADFISSFTGQRPVSTFSIPVNKIGTVLSGLSAILFVISAIKDFGKAFSSNTKPLSPQTVYVEVPQQNASAAQLG